MAKKSMADGRPALVIGVEGKPEDGDEPEGEHDDDGGGDADGVDTMRAFHEAFTKGDHQGMWDAFHAATGVASAPETLDDGDEDEEPLDGDEAIGEH